MGIVLTDSKYYAAIAAAIREKNGSADKYTPAQMADAILALSGSTSILPSGYTQLEYIQSSGTQYINTNIAHAASSNIVLSMDVAYNVASGYQIMGFNGDDGGGIGLSGSSWWDTSGIPSAAVGTKYSVEWGVNGSSVYRKVNGVTASRSRSQYSFTSNLYLFAARASTWSSTLDYYCKCKLYGAKITVNGTVVREFVPCINPSGAYGLYDIANAQFYANAGSGSFTGA